MVAGQTAVVALALLAHSQAATSGDNNLVVSGRLVCLGPDLQEASCEGAGTRLALRAAAGQRYPLAAGEAANTLLQEKRLKTREFRADLENPGWRQDLSNRQIALIRAGKVYDFHYFCEICNITTYAPRTLHVLPGPHRVPRGASQAIENSWNRRGCEHRNRALPGGRLRGGILHRLMEIVEHVPDGDDAEGVSRG